MSRIYVPTLSANDWQRLLAKPQLHWKKGRSAMTLALSWEASGGEFPPEVGNMLAASGASALKDLTAFVGIPEFQVALPGGDRPSQSDLMVLATGASGLAVMTVEGKVDEPFGPTLEEKQRDPSPGQAERSAFLLKTLGLTASTSGALRYQLLHRAVSAILLARQLRADTAIMLVHAFGGKVDNLLDFEAFCAALGTQGGANRVTRAPNLSQPSLFLAWCEGDVRFTQLEP